MNILVTGRGTSGSWIVRGLQLGHAIGATIQPLANSVKGFDLVVVVKRCPPDLLARIKQRGVPVVWDIVDAYPQPEGNAWDESQAKQWLANQMMVMQPDAIVAATDRMAKDCAEFGPVLALPHHARPGQGQNPIRPKVAKIGYEGSEKHLGSWDRAMREICRASGVEWVVNPPKLTDLDIVVALRELRGYAPTHWKSAVKAANAQDTGTPCILARESGYIEQGTGGEMYADDAEEVARCIDYLLPQEKRMHASKFLLTKDVSLETIANKYKAWLSQLRF